MQLLAGISCCLSQIGSRARDGERKRSGATSPQPDLTSPKDQHSHHVSAVARSPPQMDERRSRVSSVNFMSVVGQVPSGITGLSSDRATER
ncbi:hypothetical protein CDEST_06681 [Colletotrichum destructivum]|uniref:Uncharacterized protein n=1 Tax=Colletotrichum destructivum TaxID=34406 RepID=A0AAX4IEE1_9PEZI|nr:hypothetical protein CDEST_06681 [Colletotrichum destructivum]